MIFLTYEFVLFALGFYALYYLAWLPPLRVALISGAGLLFLFYYGGWISVAPIAVLAVTTYLAGRSSGRAAIIATVSACVATLAIFKYASFIATDVVGQIVPEFGLALRSAVRAHLPAAIPLGISFFTFEFVHYLIDVRRGYPPIRRVRDFLAFALFWPTMVAGPIKRYQQFLPALHAGIAGPSASDAMIGLMRVAIGFVKKWGADNLTGWIEVVEPHLAANDVGTRWLFLAALAARILLDFSGYSDMAIGFARMMGIAVPENFNWPYLARTPMEFWQRWHMSLSSWIRDYVYIPLGGNRFGLSRRVFNAIVAMVLCGLWHGPDWNFVVWGLYHGFGLTIGATLQDLIGKQGPPIKGRFTHAVADALSWTATMLFVAFGWLLFFYPVDRAIGIARLLFVP